jgi:hypothetical protein
LVFQIELHSFAIPASFELMAYGPKREMLSTELVGAKAVAAHPARPGLLTGPRIPTSGKPVFYFFVPFFFCCLFSF